MSPTHQDISNDTTFSQIKSRVPVPLKGQCYKIFEVEFLLPNFFWFQLTDNNSDIFTEVFWWIQIDFPVSKALEN